MIKGKFSSLRAKVIYTRYDPDDEVGSSADLGWAGLYMHGEREGGYIMHESVDGFVSLEHHDTDDQLTLAWSMAHDSLLVSGEPDEDDFVIVPSPMGYVVPQMGGRQFQDQDDALAAIKVEMDRISFFPDVWIMSDHGNYTLLTVSKD